MPLMTPRFEPRIIPRSKSSGPVVTVGSSMGVVIVWSGVTPNVVSACVKPFVKTYRMTTLSVVFVLDCAAPDMFVLPAFTPVAAIDMPRPVAEPTDARLPHALLYRQTCISSSVLPAAAAVVMLSGATKLPDSQDVRPMAPDAK